MTIVNHVGLCVRDLDASTRFYTELFGFEVRNELSVPDQFTSPLLRVPEPVGLKAVYLTLEGFVLELLAFDREGNPEPRERAMTEQGLTHLSFTVEDLAAACERAEGLGGQVLEDTKVMGMAVMIKDPDGQLLELMPARNT
jgi:catechol 2,3-dioxygenase-like lactoylglutathione lyase family enzyme